MAAPAPRTDVPASAQGIQSNDVTPELLKSLYKDMLLIRRFEEKAGQLYGMGLIGGFCHLYIGQEAVVVGVQSLLRQGDSIVTSYRDHGHMLAADMDPRRVMAELTGRGQGYSKGKGGSMHMFSREKSFFGGHGIVGAQVPIGTGLAFGHKYKKDGGLTATYMGDGAANQGQVYESFNMAALWKLPVLYIIENNRYGMGTSQSRAAAGELYKRGSAYGIPGEQVDGMDVLAVRQAVLRASERIRAGEGPAILEMMTYRYRGHSMSDPAKYRSKDEVEQMRTGHDPIEQVKKLLIERGGETDESLKAVERDVKAVVNEAAEFAQTAPEPDPAELWTEVLVDN